MPTVKGVGTSGSLLRVIDDKDEPKTLLSIQLKDENNKVHKFQLGELDKKEFAKIIFAKTISIFHEVDPYDRMYIL